MASRSNIDAPEESPFRIDEQTQNRVPPNRQASWSLNSQQEPPRPIRRTGNFNIQPVASESEFELQTISVAKESASRGAEKPTLPMVRP